MSRPLPNIDEVFFAALERESPEARSAYLDEVCGSDPDLRRRVERLLDAQSKVGNFLDAPAAGATLTLAPPQAIEGPGTAIGPYKLLEQIGEGGMGVVYMAEQTQPVRRKVALKIIKPGMDTKQVIARFEAERQALELMDHPNIARVLDAGATESSRPYFVMELVKGVPITEYSDQHRLTIPERLNLFMQVCHAVQHAHQKGVIHRDIKPSNVLVTSLDGVPLPRVIDFGIAKATGPSLTDKTLFTGFAQLVGTPLYMSPEQAELSAVDVDTRTDIYSLGVLLYELLTGTTPFDQNTFRTAALDEVRRIIREQEPPKPSTRLSGLGATTTTVSENRQTDPRKLNRSLRGELDWIVMKALEKDRNRRYETPSGLARDVERYLAGEPVEAGPPSAWYCFRKFARRNRLVLTATGLIALSLVAGTTVSVWQAIVARHARAEAIAQRDEARRAVDDMYTDVAEKWLAQQAALEPMQRIFLQKALAYYQRFAGEESADPKVRSKAGSAYERMGLIQERLGRYPEAEAAHRRGMAILEKLVAGAPLVSDYRSGLASIQSNLGDMLNKLGQHAEGELLLRKAITLGEKLVADSPAVAQYRDGLAAYHDNLGSILRETGRTSEAEQAHRRAVALREELVSNSPSVPEYRNALARSQHNLGNLLQNTGRWAEAEHEYRRSIAIGEKLAADAPSVPQYRGNLADRRKNLGDLLYRMGHFGEAEQVYRQAIALLEKLVSDSPSVPEYLDRLVLSLNGLGAVCLIDRPAEAVQAFRRASDLSTKLVANLPSVVGYQSDLAMSQGNLGEALKKIGRYSEAEQAYRQAIALNEKLAGDSPSVPQYRTYLAAGFANLGNLLRMSGRRVEAEQPYRRAIALEEKLAADSPSVPQYRSDLAWSHRDLGSLLGQIGRRAGSEPEYRLAVVLFEKLVAELPASAEYQDGLTSSDAKLASFLEAAGRPVEAEQALRRAIGHADKLADAEAQNEVSWVLATKPNRGLHEQQLALQLAKKAVEREPQNGSYWNTLGLAHYRGGDWKAAIQAFEKSMQLEAGDNPAPWLFLAMACWQNGEREKARSWYDKAIQGMEKNKSQDEELGRFRAEAAVLLCITEHAAATGKKGENAKQSSTP